MDKTDEPRKWICPVSGALFEADSDEQNQVKKFDKFGKPVTTFTVNHVGDTPNP